MAARRGMKAVVTVVWWSAILCAAIYCVARIAGGNAFESNIMALVPTSGDGRQWQPQLAEDADLQKSFLILIKESNGDSALARATALRDALSVHPGIDIDPGLAALPETLRVFFYPYRHQLLSREMREKLKGREPGEIARSTLSALYSPMQGIRPYSLRDDPFNLAGSWLRALYPEAENFVPGRMPVLRNGDSTWYLVRARLRNSPFTLDSQRAVAEVLDKFANAWPRAEFLRSGFVFHAAEATTIARREISTVGLGSVLAIVALVIAVFRSRQAIFAIAVTLAASLLLALAASLALFDRIHLITLAFGSTLLGLSVDYCFHFLVKWQRLGDGVAACRAISRGLVLSASSSIAAYLVQLLSPFPGLRQFAVFVSFGLLGAGLTLVFLAFWCNGTCRFAVTGQLFDRRVAPLYRMLARRRATCLIIVFAVIIAALAQAARHGLSDDIRQLNTSSETLVADEAAVANLLGGIDSQRYWTIEGRDKQEVLERTDRLVAALPKDLEVMSTTNLVPSLKQQRRDHRLVMEKLYGPGGALEILCRTLGPDCKVWLSQDFNYQPGLTPQRLPAALSEAFPVLKLADANHGIVFPQRGTTWKGDISLGITRTEGVRFVDKVAMISDTMAGFRVQVIGLLMLFLVLFAVLTLRYYRRRGVGVVIAVLASLSVALALSSGNGITLFHVLALLLVTGITIDTAIFYLELGLDGDSWLAATLATLTSILAFGLLSLSQMPVLHQFGAVVFSGLACAWLVTPLLHMLGNRPIY